MEDNVTLALAALKLAEAAAVPRFFVASSAAVYGAQDGPLREDMPCAPLSEYGRQKLAMEQRMINSLEWSGRVAREVTKGHGETTLLQPC